MEKEWKANARGAGAKGQYEIRKSIIRMLREGKSGQETAKLLGVSEGHVSNVRKLTGVQLVSLLGFFKSATASSQLVNCLPSSGSECYFD